MGAWLGGGAGERRPEMEAGPQGGEVGVDYGKRGEEADRAESLALQLHIQQVRYLVTIGTCRRTPSRCVTLTQV